MDQQSLAKQVRQEAGAAMTRQMKQEGNATMIERILAMPVTPDEDGKLVYRVVEIRGRQSGKLRRAPLAVFQYDGKRYLIAPERSRDWVQNLQATGECLLLAKAQQEHCHASLAFDTAALAAVRAYVGGLAWASKQFPFSINDADAEILAKSEQFAIFRLS